MLDNDVIGHLVIAFQYRKSLHNVFSFIHLTLPFKPRMNRATALKYQGDVILWCLEGDFYILP